MKTYFISDLHLDESQPQNTELFLNFLTHQAKQADALYILGDFFEVWVGDDEQTKLQQRIIQALNKLTKQNVPVYFQHGNRDFLIGKRFAKASGIKILKQPTTIHLYGQTISLMHGDQLCTDDITYQKFRRKARNPFYQAIFRCLPIKYRKQIATKLREKSKRYTQKKHANIMDVNQQAVDRVFEKYSVSTLIHGHTHCPAIHQEKHGQRIVLGAWDDKAMILEYEKGKRFTLIDLMHGERKKTGKAPVDPAPYKQAE